MWDFETGLNTSTLLKESVKEDVSCTQFIKRITYEKTVL